MLNIISILLVLTAIFSLLNERYLRLQITIGLTLLGFLFAIILSLIGYFAPDTFHKPISELLTQIDFSQVVLQGVLCFLLFAGAKNTSLSNLKEHRWHVITLAFAGTLIATFAIGALIYFILNAIGIHLSFMYSLIFGSIIATTDPVAAIAILKSIGLPDSIEIIIDGESQFNDGVGVVIFVTLTGIAFGHGNSSAGDIVILFAREVLGGIGLGILTALITHILLVRSKTNITQVLITLAAVAASYSSATLIEVSGPIASVVLGLLVGNISLAALQTTPKKYLDTFWEMVDQILNAVLFVLIGLAAFKIGAPAKTVVISCLIAIVCVLIGRYFSVYISMLILRTKHRFNFSSRFKLASLFTWAGLHGALGVALVLSLPNQSIKNALLPMVYAVVLFSILIQGSTIKFLFSPNTLKKLATPDFK